MNCMYKAFLLNPRLTKTKRKMSSTWGEWTDGNKFGIRQVSLKVFMGHSAGFL